MKNIDDKMIEIYGNWATTDEWDRLWDAKKEEMRKDLILTERDFLFGELKPKTRKNWFKRLLDGFNG